MIIEELILTSFGKFKNRNLKLKDGLNIVYGDNEAGKTTIHKFIEGMLFGFFKPYTRRKVYTEEYDRYYPWEQNDYRGVLKYNYEDTFYRIERNFEKGNDEVKILDEKTGEDITCLFQYDKVKRLHEPASIHLGLNHVVYSNTISIKQLGNKTDEALSKEVKDNLINLGGSMDEDISVKRVVERMNSQLDEIGTKNRVKTSPYGRITEELGQLQKEREYALDTLSKIKIQQRELNQLMEEIESLITYKEGIENTITLIQSLKAKDRYNAAIKLINEIKTIDEEIKDVRKYEGIDSDDFTQAIKIDNAMEVIEDTIKHLKEKEERTKGKLKKLTSHLKDYVNFESIEDASDIDRVMSDYLIMDNLKKEVVEVDKKLKALNERIEVNKNTNLSDLNDDFYIYEEKEEKRDKLLYNRDYTNVAFLRARFEEKEKGKKRLRTYKILSSIGGFTVIPLSLLIHPLLLLGLLIPIGIYLYLWVASKELNKYISKIRSQLQDIEENQASLKQKVNDIEEEMDIILKKYECTSKAEFRRMVGELSRESTLQSNNLNTQEELMKKKEHMNSEIKTYGDHIIKHLTLLGDDMPITFENVKLIKAQYNKYLELKKSKVSIEAELTELTQECQGTEDKHQSYKERLEKILARNKVETMDEFKEALNKRKVFDDLTQKIENKNQLLSNILGDNSLEFLKRKAEKVENKNLAMNKNTDKEELEQQHKEITETTSKKKQTVTRLEESIKNLSNKTRTLVTIEEEILRKSRVKEKYEKKLMALEMAKDTIENISKNIHRDFAPKLNRKVGGIISNITQGKYVEVKITENIDIKITDPANNRLINIHELSGGTIDQIYFATRFGIIDIIKENNNVPLILDDCFVQYDKNRLSSILKFLAKESDNRQVVLFTCHGREQAILDEMAVGYNYISL